MRAVQLSAVAGICAAMALGPARSQGAVVFSDDFSSYPVSGQTNEWVTPTGPWTQGGNAVFNQILSDSGDNYMNMIVGGSANQSANLFTPSVGPSIPAGQAVSFTMDVKSINFSTYEQLFRIAVLPGTQGTPWWTASDGFELYLASGYLKIAGKTNKPGNNGETYNYADGGFNTSDIKSVDIQLTNTQFTVTLTGTFTLSGPTNVVNHGDTTSTINNTHSISWTGTHNLPWSNFSTASGGYELFNQSGGAFTADIDNVNMSVVPEPAALSLLGLGVLALRRRR